MKFRIRLLLHFVLLLALSSVSLIRAQAPSTSLDSLYVAFWPDYDDPSVLVLMTGTLPANASYPAEVTIPLPPQAEVNAVARINSEVGMADVEYQVVDDKLTFTTPDEQFRVEYYSPYADDGEWRNFDFAWNADIDVQEFTAEIQQPVNATSLTTQPLAANIGTGPSDGLTYHALPSQEIPSGTPYEMNFRYKMNSPGLTAGGSPPTESNNSTPNNTVESSPANNWLLILAGAGVLLLVAGVTWFVAIRTQGNGKPRRSSRSRKVRKRSSKASSTQQAQFCHTCGTQASKGDQFCRNCGTELKR